MPCCYLGWWLISSIVVKILVPCVKSALSMVLQTAAHMRLLGAHKELHRCLVAARYHAHMSRYIARNMLAHEPHELIYSCLRAAINLLTWCVLGCYKCV